MNPHGDKLRLPDALVEDLRAGKRPLSEQHRSVLASMLKFVEQPLPGLYDMPSIVQENGLWTSSAVRHYLGKSNTLHPPGDIDPALALIIGQAEYDGPIALDYRTSPPRVLYLAAFERRSCWMELADSYEQLMSKLAAGSGKE